MSSKGKILLVAVATVVALVLAFTVVGQRQTPGSPSARQVDSGTATLSWVAPTANEDDSPLTDLAGYVIHCWNASGQHLEPVYVSDPEATRYEVRNLPPGRYHCAVAAINENGNESELSNMLSRTVQP
jgi:hypothetical protein